MRRALLLLPRLLAAGFFAILALIGALTLARPVLSQHLPGVYRDWTRPLVGMQVNTPPLKLGSEPWLTGESQAGWDGWLNSNLLQRPAIVRAYNTAQWTAFSTSYMANGSLVRGRNDVLFEFSYIGTHCGQRWMTELGPLPDVARRLKAVQDALEARGQQFVYVVAAVKTPQMGQYVPGEFACPDALRDVTYKPAVDILHRAGVRVVDTRAVLVAARAGGGPGFYPRNGIHWNQLGAAIAARALTDELRRRDPRIAPLAWRVAQASDEPPGDRDLSVLLNLWREPAGWPAPLVEATPLPAAGSTSLVAVNDSFFKRMADVLQQAGTFRVIRAHGYLTLEQVEYSPQGVTPLAMDGPAIRNDILGADVVVVEEVESRIGGPFVLQFLELMEPALDLSPTAPTAG